MDNTSISVIIPLYNKAPYIANAIDSVLMQTIQDFEIIIVGGKSTDGGEEIVKKYNDERIQLIQEKGCGVSAARNQGVDAARADIVAFLDADDEWLPEFLETILQMRFIYPDAGMYGTGYERHSSKKIRYCYNLNIPNYNISSYYFKYIIKYPEIIKTSSSAFDKNAFKRIGGFQIGYPWNEDGALFTKFAIESSVIYNPKICVIYNEDAINNTKIPLNYQENPLIEYIKSLPPSKYKMRGDCEELMIYCEKNRIDGYMRNFTMGYGHMFKHQLVDVFHPTYYYDRWCMKLISFIPDRVSHAFIYCKYTRQLYLFCISGFVSSIPRIFKMAPSYNTTDRNK